MSSADLFEDGFPHGTREGYDRGCHGGACPEGVEGRRTCREANMAYAGDQVYRHRVNAGMTPVQIAEEEAKDRAVEKIAGTGKPPAARVPAAPPKPAPPALASRPQYEEPTRALRAPFSPAELASLRELHATGLSDTDIAKAIGRSQAPTSSHLRKMGLPPNGKRVGVNAPPPEPDGPAEAIVEREHEVRAEGVLAELGEAQAEVERLQGELDTTSADLAIAETANGTLQEQLAAALQKASAAEEGLLQANLKHDVELSAAQSSGAELVSSPSAPVASVEELPVARAGSVGLDIHQLGDALSVRLHGGEPVHLNLQFVDGALADVGVKIGA